MVPITFFLRSQSLYFPAVLAGFLNTILGSVSVALNPTLPDRRNPTKLESILKVIVRKLQVIPDVPHGN